MALPRPVTRLAVSLQVSKAKPGTQQVKKAQSPIRKNFPAPRGTRSTSKYGKSQQEDQLWLPNTERPGWLDGSMPGLPPLHHSITLCKLACSGDHSTGYSTSIAGAVDYLCWLLY